MKGKGKGDGKGKCRGGIEGRGKVEEKSQTFWRHTPNTDKDTGKWGVTKNVQFIN
jgi:hypothetical protein